MIDIGSGTGHGGIAAAEVLKEVEILAVEPSPTMRTALLSRSMQTGALRKRVTVVPSSFESFKLPEKIRAVLFLGCIGFMEEKARKEFWSQLAPHMTAGSLILLMS